MSTPHNEDPASLEPPQKETGLARRSGFIARRVRDLARTSREHELVDDTEVVFPDKSLEAAVRADLGKPEGKLTKRDLRRLERLNPWILITDLHGLEHAVNLTELVLFRGRISDLGPLSSLSKLTVFGLMDRTLIRSQISDLSPLSPLTNLTMIGLGGDIISDISPLASLTNLTQLILGDNQISDISPLASLTNLTELQISDNQISDISPLASLPKLDYVELARNPLNKEAIAVYAPMLSSRGVGVNL